MQKNLNYTCGKMTYIFYYLLIHTESVKNLKIGTVPGFWVPEIVRKINLNDAGTLGFRDSHKVPGLSWISGTLPKTHGSH